MTHEEPDAAPGRPESDPEPPQHRYASLWSPPVISTRGRPARVSRAEVVDAAVAIADADGRDAVSMRSVARALGVGAMTLYSHVPGRDELVDAMVDRGYADFDLPDPGLPWRPALELYARGYWSLLRQHPWLLDVNPWRLPLAPHVFTVQEAGYRILVDTGLTASQVIETLDIVNNMVAGSARSAAAEDADRRTQGTDYAAYWEATGDFWERTFDPTRFPTMTRLWSVGAFDTASTPFEPQVKGLLDTLELLIERAQSEGGATIPTFEECMDRYDEAVAQQLGDAQS
ncbi:MULTISPECIES: TetR/AcrR family transcriptional regulator [Mumia]|uniref:TetR/AcrR family transcriptional regulator n=1 Tax=Mumia TaxID=1546255 RepID=UPI0014210D16|nr:TetR/AcrR family transcriptional regulator [Mumia sp. ZJ1417]QMW67053.1 TetR/AcrR family transcriptional regulator [Mumia sp. ZJ1417]